MDHDPNTPPESPAQRVLRERRESQHMTDLTGAPRDLQHESEERQETGAGSKEPLGRIVKEEETPSDALKTDGSHSPHDATSDGGSRQGAAHAQLDKIRKLESDAKATRTSADAPNAVNQAPTAEQAASGQAAADEGRAE